MALRFLNNGYFAGKVGIGTNVPTSTLTVSSSVGADGSWNKSGILIENTSTTTGEPTLAFRNAGTAGTGANYWHTGLNQSNVYKIAYGTSFTDGNTKFELSTNGALRLNSYTQGFLQTDANGNINLSGGGTLPGGPYLPLAGGTMTGTSFVQFPDNFDLYLGSATNGDFQAYHDGSNTYLRNLNGNLIIKQDKVDADLILESDDGSGGTTPYLTLDGSITKMVASKDIHFDGTVKATFGSNATPASIYYNGNDDVDTGTETVANVVIATHTAAFFDFVIKKGTNVRSGTVYACHDGTTVQFTETSTQDLGDTSDVTLSVDISGGNMRLRATTTSDDWSVKSLIRAI